MSKFLKQLGFGNKKNPPAPPKRDYRLGYATANEAEDDHVDEEVVSSTVPGAAAVAIAGLSSTWDGVEADHRKASRQQQPPDQPSGGEDSHITTGSQELEDGDGTVLTPPPPNANGISAEMGHMDHSTRPINRKSNNLNVLENYSDPADTIHLPISSTGHIPTRPFNENDYMLPYEAQKAVDKYKENLYDPPADLFLRTTVPSADDVWAGHIPEDDSRPTEDYDAPWEWNSTNRLAKIRSNFERSSGVPGCSYENDQHVTGKEIDPFYLRCPSAEKRTPGTPDGVRLKPVVAPKPLTFLDTRPTEDYDDPWDLKNKQVAMLCTLNKTGSPSPRPKISSTVTVNAKPPPLQMFATVDLVPYQTPVGDDRPEDQYDEPWELRAKGQVSALDNQPVHYTPQSSPRHRSNSPMNPAGTLIGNTDVGGVWPESNATNKQSAVGSLTPPCVGQQQSDMDERPDDEYDAPWEYATETNRVPSPEPGLMMAQLHSPTHINPGRRYNSSPELPPDPRWNKATCRNIKLRYDRPKLVPVGELVDPTIPLEQQQWYHGSITRVEAEHTLRPCKECSFLIRNSQSAKQDYSLSAKSANGFLHMKIEWRDGHYILGQFSQLFNSIPEMIFHYSLNKLNILGAENMCLLYPVSCLLF